MPTPEVELGLKKNWKQFALLVIINGFVGGMIGLERTIIPRIAESDFGISANSAIFSFIIVFGITKAITNYFTGVLFQHFSRKQLLITGWVVALPVPVLLMLADSWNWIIAANILLGISQGLTWSSTIIMKIDLVGEKNRGLAMGINEFAGYLAMAMIAFTTGYIAWKYGLRPYPFYIGIGIAVAGLLLTWGTVKDTKRHADMESVGNKTPRLKNIFWESTWKNPNLGSVTQAGLVNNLNDGMVWGLFPILLASKGFDLKETGIIVAIYPGVWGIGQLFTGALSDYFCKRNLLSTGMVLQGVALLFMAWSESFISFALASTFLGTGTAIVYPTFLASLSENTHPEQRPQSMGVFRFWRDLGYAIGALLTGLMADNFGLVAPVFTIGLLTIGSGFLISFRMKCAEKNDKMKQSDYIHSLCV